MADQQMVKGCLAPPLKAEQYFSLQLNGSFPIRQVCHHPIERSLLGMILARTNER